VNETVPILQARQVRKSYGGTHALKGVDFEVHRGSVTTLFGENGAGKSTLMKILSGVERLTSGELLKDGEPVDLQSTGDANDLGICIVHQELSLAPNLSVSDNIFMGREMRNGLGLVRFREQERIAAGLLARLHTDIDPRTRVGDLRVGQQQMVEIARALSMDAEVLIMDEPTSALSAFEVEVLFTVIDDLTADGVGIVYISHHLEEALSVSDDVVVLRDGTVVGAAAAKDIDLPWVVHQMVGEGFRAGDPPAEDGFGDVVLDVSGLVVTDPTVADRRLVDGLDLQVCAGEIVCLYGLMGAGRTELLEAIAGRTPVAAGSISVEGRGLGTRSIRERIEDGIVLVPEDRQRDGLVQTLSVGANLSLASLADQVRGLFVSRPAEQAASTAMAESLHVKTAGLRAAIGSLSGGNQQKVVIGKALLTEPNLLLLDEPSRGIDIGAKSEVFQLLTRLAGEGLAVVYSTSEVAECLGVANRVIVLRRGRIAAEFDSESATEPKIMAASGEKQQASDSKDVK
jgi:erythritol transport system ATP-binding protein